MVDLYDTNKIGAAGEWLPRETVLEYAWQEEVILANDPQKGLDFGKYTEPKSWIAVGRWSSTTAVACCRGSVNLVQNTSRMAR